MGIDRHHWWAQIGGTDRQLRWALTCGIDEQ
ncbi:unnamed protein product [Staurois parvus]|uniref:Uncharacterized protein n=1 Tax=Staurois parvus TaxID=386267 RepID=A0ABN9CLJ7_9NEOB|nr:unnamed protein product [Staurois parvus]